MTLVNEETGSDSAVPDSPVPPSLPVPVPPPAPMAAADVRQYIYAQPYRQQDLPTPFWPAINGKIALRDVPGDEALNFGNPAAYPGGAASMVGEMLCRTLLNKDDGQLIFPLTERDFLAHQLGMSVLGPILKTLYIFLGLGSEEEAAKMLEDVKKNLEQSLKTSSGTD